MLHIHNAKSAKMAARSLEKFVSALGFELKHGQALDALATMSGFQGWAALNDSMSPEALDARLTQAERDHIEDNQDVKYGPEYAVVAHNGFELRYAQEGELLDYVRICDPLGREIAYWVHDEWQQDPQVVMGAILGALVQGGPVEVGATTVAKTCVPAHEAARQPSIMDLYPFDSVSHVVVDGCSYPVRSRDAEVAKLLEEAAGDADEEDDAHHVVLDLHFEEDGHDVEHTLTVAELRELRWSAKGGGFVNKDGILYEFYVASKFGERSTAPVLEATAVRADTPASLEGAAVELFEVYWEDAKGVRCSPAVGRVAGRSADESLRNFRAHIEVHQRLADAYPNGSRLAAIRLDKDQFGPYEVFVDGGYYAECPTLSDARAVMELFAQNCEEGAEVRDSSNWTVAYEKPQQDS